jgi:hypothetical protein
MARCDHELYSECWDQVHELCLRFIDIEKSSSGSITPDMADYLRDRQAEKKQHVEDEDDQDSRLVIVRQLTLLDMVTMNRVDLVETYDGDCDVDHYELRRALSIQTSEMYDAFVNNPMCPVIESQIHDFFASVVCCENRGLLEHMCIKKGIDAINCLSIIWQWGHLYHTDFLHDLHDAAVAAGHQGVPLKERNRMFREEVADFFNNCKTMPPILYKVMSKHMIRMLNAAWYA